jgi:hypothetical protein
MIHLALLAFSELVVSYASDCTYDVETSGGRGRYVERKSFLSAPFCSWHLFCCRGGSVVRGRKLLSWMLRRSRHSSMRPTPSSRRSGAKAPFPGQCLECGFPAKRPSAKVSDSRASRRKSRSNSTTSFALAAIPRRLSSQYCCNWWMRES